MSYERRQFSGSALDSNLATGIGATDLSWTGTDLTGWPDGSTGKFEVILDPDMPTEEHSLASSRSGNTVTYASIADRGLDNTTAQSHSSMAVVRHGLSKIDVDEANYAVSQTVGQIAAKGDLLVGSAANALVKVAAGTSGQVPIWQSDGSVTPGTPVPAAHTHAETDVTSLTTDLGNKLAKPATAFAKGSLLVGTGAGTYDNTAVGTDGTVLTADSTSGDGVSWKPSPTISLLGSTSYAGPLTTVTSSLAALDKTNLTLTFTAPSSGKVLLRASIEYSGPNGSFSITAGWYMHNTTTQVGVVQTLVSFNWTSGSTLNAGTVQSEQVASGLTPGQSYTLDLAGSMSSTSPSMRNFALTAWAA